MFLGWLAVSWVLKTGCVSRRDCWVINTRGPLLALILMPNRRRPYCYQTAIRNAGWRVRLSVCWCLFVWWSSVCVCVCLFIIWSHLVSRVDFRCSTVKKKKKNLNTGFQNLNIVGREAVTIIWNVLKYSADEFTELNNSLRICHLEHILLNSFDPLLIDKNSFCIIQYIRIQEGVAHDNDVTNCLLRYDSNEIVDLLWLIKLIKFLLSYFNAVVLAQCMLLQL